MPLTSRVPQCRKLQPSDMIDGVEFGRFYKRLDIQPGEMPLVFIFYYDGLEVVNGLDERFGALRGQ